jgi:hypothetical protein
MSEREARITEAAEGAGFRLRRLFGREELSRTYAFHVLVESGNHSLDLGQLLGTKLGVEMDAHQGTKQHYHGYVMDAVLAGRDLDKTLYELTVVPWLWFLDCGADCRIFQELTVPEIVEQVFAGYPIADFVPLQPSRTYRPRTYTVQYRESDYAFVARLLEDEGIFYFFRHEATRHKLVLVDHVAALKAQTSYDRVPFLGPGGRACATTISSSRRPISPRRPRTSPPTPSAPVRSTTTRAATPSWRTVTSVRRPCSRRTRCATAAASAPATLRGCAAAPPSSSPAARPPRPGSPGSSSPPTSRSRSRAHARERPPAASRTAG